ncbi:MAG: hypothetical protein GXP55_25830, partial [Deltaproteobacteria bacterium]|nr:hypothetical protein [Deltaproteobacteria bacterium]
ASTRDAASGDVGARVDAASDSGARVDAAVDSGAAVDAGPAVCVPVMCQGALRACGDCVDNDDDGAADARDSNCLGACDNNESGLSTGIPGGDTPQCGLDCYYDTDQGSGNDQCHWDGRCDPLSPDARCSFEDPPPPSARCPDTQSSACLDFCRPLTPNGCDCFGCCELPARSGSFVFLGSVDSAGDPSCTMDAVGDATRCHPCTPVRGECFNPCGRCELCVGRDPGSLPADCFPPPTPTDAGTPADAGARCDPGVQACGLPGDPACPSAYYCLTGCCILFG